MTYVPVDSFTKTNMAEILASSNITGSVGIKTAISFCSIHAWRVSNRNLWLFTFDSDIINNDTAM